MFNVLIGISQDFYWYLHVCMLSLETPGCITDVRQSDCAADVMLL